MVSLTTGLESVNVNALTTIAEFWLNFFDLTELWLKTRLSHSSILENETEIAFRKYSFTVTVQVNW